MKFEILTRLRQLKCAIEIAVYVTLYRRLCISEACRLVVRLCQERLQEKKLLFAFSVFIVLRKDTIILKIAQSPSIHISEPKIERRFLESNQRHLYTLYSKKPKNLFSIRDWLMNKI